MSAGRFLTGSDDDNLSTVVVIGSDVAATLFPHSSPLGARIRVRGRPFTVVGVLAPKGKILDENQDLARADAAAHVQGAAQRAARATRSG